MSKKTRGRLRRMTEADRVKKHDRNVARDRDGKLRFKAWAARTVKK